MAEIDFDAVLRNHGFVKMKPIPLDVEILDLTSTKNHVFVRWPAVELLADGPTLEAAISDFVESLIKSCELLLSPDAVLTPHGHGIKKIIREYIQPITTEGLMN